MEAVDILLWFLIHLFVACCETYIYARPCFRGVKEGWESTSSSQKGTKSSNAKSNPSLGNQTIQ